MRVRIHNVVIADGKREVSSFTGMANKSDNAFIISYVDQNKRLGKMSIKTESDCIKTTTCSGLQKTELNFVINKETNGKLTYGKSCNNLKIFTKHLTVTENLIEIYYELKFDDREIINYEFKMEVENG